LSLIFGFNDKQPTLVLSYWLFNFITILLFTTVSLGLHIYAQKRLAKKYGCNVILDLWKLKRIITARRDIKIKLTKKLSITYIPIGIILSIFTYILSSGQIIFAAITSIETKINKTYRIGKKYVNLTDIESAKIAVVGPLVNIFLALIASQITAQIAKPLVIINLAMAVSYMLPLPGIAGGTIFFGSKPLYIASLAFIGVIALLMNFMSTASTVLIAFTFSIAALVSYLMYEAKH
jgi:Zn-dependent protease